METKKAIVYTVGQKLTLEMIQPEKGKMPIARTDEGLICVIDHDITKGFFPYGSIWDCSVTLVCQKKLVIKPLKMLKSAEDNLADIAKKTSEFFGKKKEEKVKIKKSFPFQTRQEASWNK